MTLVLYAILIYRGFRDMFGDLEFQLMFILNSISMW